MLPSWCSVGNAHGLLSRELTSDSVPDDSKALEGAGLDRCVLGYHADDPAYMSPHWSTVNVATGQASRSPLSFRGRSRQLRCSATCSG